MRIRGRDWKWWIVGNGHYCRFCYEKIQRFKDTPSLGGMVVAKYKVNMTHPDYWKRLYQVWLAHMKEYHPEILATQKKEASMKMQESLETRRKEQGNDFQNANQRNPIGRQVY